MAGAGGGLRAFESQSPKIFVGPARLFPNACRSRVQRPNKAVVIQEASRPRTENGRHGQKCVCFVGTYHASGDALYIQFHFICSPSPTLQAAVASGRPFRDAIHAES